MWVSLSNEMGSSGLKIQGGWFGTVGGVDITSEPWGRVQ